MASVGNLLNTTDIQSLIDKVREDHRERPRPHLGCSMLAHSCDRYIWLSFRWAVNPNFPGRILRVFRRGQNEEHIIAEDLKSIGIKIHSTGDEQVTVDLGCHVSGSVDGIIESGVPGAEKTRHIAEFKTHSLKSFADLKSKGVKKSKPMHYGQMQLYMMGTNIDRALYIAVCKDNDEIYAERVPYCAMDAEILKQRGHRLALLERMPSPLSQDGTWWECKYCSFHNFCFKTHLADGINCRTCAKVTPKPDGTWECSEQKKTLTVDDQFHGCWGHVAHPDLVPWKLITGDANSGTYEIKGKRYINGNPCFVPDAQQTDELYAIWAMDDKATEAEIPF